MCFINERGHFITRWWSRGCNNLHLSCCRQKLLVETFYPLPPIDIGAAKPSLVTTYITLNSINWAWWSPQDTKGKSLLVEIFLKHLWASKQHELEIEKSIQALLSICPGGINLKSRGWGPRSRKACKRCNLNSVTFSQLRHDGRPLIWWPDGESVSHEGLRVTLSREGDLRDTLGCLWCCYNRTLNWPLSINDHGHKDWK